MIKGIGKFFSAFFLAVLILFFSTASITPISAMDSKDKTQEQSHKRNAKLRRYPENKGRQRNYHPQQSRQLEVNNLPQAKDQLKIFISDLGEKKNRLQKTYTYWTLSTAHAVYSLYNSSEDAFYRCLHVALNIAPYITPHLPSKAQPYFQGGINGAGFLLEGMRALVHTKRWAWEQILGYSSLCFMRALPEGALNEEMQGGLYFFFKAAGFYHVNFSLPCLPDSLWEQIKYYNTFTTLDEEPSNVHFNMSKAQKLKIYNDLDSAFHDAEYCEPDTYEFLKKNRLLEAYRGKIDSCKMIIDGWENLRPQHFENRFFSIDSSSEVLVVNQREYAVANGHDFIHVFVTGDLMKCVGLALYNSEINRCGLAHVDGENIRSLDAYLEGKLTLKDNIDDFHRVFLDIAEKTPLKKIRATLVSGHSPHINYLKKYMENFGIKNIEVIYNPEWGKKSNGYEVREIDRKTGKSRIIEMPKGSIAINCQTGAVSNVTNEPEIRKKMGPPPEDKGNPRPLIKIRGGNEKH